MTIKNTYCRYGIRLFFFFVPSTLENTRELQTAFSVQLYSFNLQLAILQLPVPSPVSLHPIPISFFPIPTVTRLFRPLLRLTVADKSHLCVAWLGRRCWQCLQWSTLLSPVSPSCSHSPLTPSSLLYIVCPVICVINKKPSWQLWVCVCVYVCAWPASDVKRI